MAVDSGGGVRAGHIEAGEVAEAGCLLHTIREGEWGNAHELSLSIDFQLCQHTPANAKVHGAVTPLRWIVVIGMVSKWWGSPIRVKSGRCSGCSSNLWADVCRPLLRRGAGTDADSQSRPTPAWLTKTLNCTQGAPKSTGKIYFRCENPCGVIGKCDWPVVIGSGQWCRVRYCAPRMRIGLGMVRNSASYWQVDLARGVVSAACPARAGSPADVRNRPFARARAGPPGGAVPAPTPGGPVIHWILLKNPCYPSTRRSLKAGHQTHGISKKPGVRCPRFSVSAGFFSRIFIGKTAGSG